MSDTDENGFPRDLDCLHWDVAVYVRARTMDFDKVRDAFLCSMGGQVKCYCERHDVPLIIASKSSARQCCCGEDGADCKKKVVFECPCPSCPVGICRHFHTTSQPDDGGVKVNVKYPVEEDILADSEESWDPDRDGSVTDDNDEDDNIGRFTSNDLAGIDTWMEEDNSIHSWHGSDNESVVSDDLSEGIMLDLGGECTEDVGGQVTEVVAGMDISLEEEEEENGDCFVPTTSSGAPGPLAIQGSGGSVWIGGHCILNCCGNCLCRKGKKIKGTMRQRSFLERIVSSVKGHSVPLVYPEAMLFPSIFWRDILSDGSIIGAIPSALLANTATLKRLGIASVESHMRTRMKNSALLTSTDDAYLCYAFDTVVNLGCQHADTRVILHRGLCTSTNEGIKGAMDQQPAFETDSVDSRPVVHKLAATFSEGDGTYFYTHSVNQRDHFGVKEIKHWIDSDELERIVMEELFNSGELTPSDEAEMRASIAGAAAVTILCNWIETAEIWMTYIMNSKERPLGHVWRMWWRHEYQESAGNLSHIHALLWLKHSKEETEEVTLDRIRGSTLQLVRTDEIASMIEEGLLESDLEYGNILDLAGRVLLHACSKRCRRRTGPGENDFVCRATDNGKENPCPWTHTMRTVPVHHSSVCLGILQQLGLAQRNVDCGTWEMLNDKLVASIHYPPANSAEGIISPCNGWLFVATCSHQNLKRCTGYLASRYLAKYVAAVDQHNRVFVGAMGQAENSVRLRQEFLANTKITSSAMHEETRLKQVRDKKHPTGRAISMMEAISVVLQYPQVYTNIEFVHVSTLPLAERPGIDIQTGVSKLKRQQIISVDQVVLVPEDLNSGDVIPSYHVRNENSPDLERWRKISNSEALTLRDQLLSPVSVDCVTSFGVRPPELRFVRDMKFYYRWFYHCGKCGRNYQKIMERVRKSVRPGKLEDGEWINGMNVIVRVRRQAVQEIIAYLAYEVQESDFYAEDEDPFDYEGEPLIDTREFFVYLSTMMTDPPKELLSQKCWEREEEFFLGEFPVDGNNDLPVVWFPNVRPFQPHRWILHILFSMGRFDNEYSLLGGGSMKSALIRAKLVRDTEDEQELEASVHSILKRYVLEQLVYLPGGSRQFDRYLAAANHALRECLFHDNMASDELPASLYTKIHSTTDQKTKEYMLDMRTQLTRVLLSDFSSKQICQLPTEDELLSCTTGKPVAWTFSLLRHIHQSDPSFAEQEECIETGQRQITKYEDPGPGQVTKGVIIIGGPGVGKTTLLQIFALIALSRGLCVQMSALMAERSKQLGGSHLAKVFGIPVNEKASPTRLAALAVMTLLRSPNRFEALLRIDVLFLDELGTVSAEFISMLDMIARRIRCRHSLWEAYL